MTSFIARHGSRFKVMGAPSVCHPVSVQLAGLIMGDLRVSGFSHLREDRTMTKILPTDASDIPSWCFLSPVCAGILSYPHAHTPQSPGLWMHSSRGCLVLLLLYLCWYLVVAVNTTPHRAHFTHANLFSRVAQELIPHQHTLSFVSPFKRVISILMPQAQSLLPDFLPLPLPQHAPSPQFPSHSGTSQRSTLWWTVWSMG